MTRNERERLCKELSNDSVGMVTAVETNDNHLLVMGTGNIPTMFALIIEIVHHLADAMGITSQELLVKMLLAEEVVGGRDNEEAGDDTEDKSC